MNTEYYPAKSSRRKFCQLSWENVFKTFDFSHIWNNDNSDPDKNFFKNKFDVVDSTYSSIEEVPCKVEKYLEHLLSVLHDNITSLTKNFEKLLEFLRIMKNEFHAIAITEMWCKDDSINVNLLYQITSYTPIHQIRKTGNKGGGLALYIHKTITFNTLEKISNNNEHIEGLSVEIIRKNQKNIILLCIYRHPSGNQMQNHKSLVLNGDLT